MEDYLMIPFDKKNPSLEKIHSKCTACGVCKKICDEITVSKIYDLNTTKRAICINCGQCSLYCPVNAIVEKKDYKNVQKIIKAKNKIVTVSLAPAVRVALGEEFGISYGTNIEKKIVTALRKLGFNYVFDVTFGADLTIMEEAKELAYRIGYNLNLPLITSCCPAWVKYAEIFHPKIIHKISTCKSPISMQGATIKTYFAEKRDINPKDIINVAIAPCTAKKAEIKREELKQGDYFDNDFVITTRELAEWLKEEAINVAELEEQDFDSPLGEGTGAGVIFGNTGGVAEAALRTAYHYITGKDLEPDKIKFNELRGTDGIKVAEVAFGGNNIKIAVVNGMKNAKVLLDEIANGNCLYQFIEIMNCTGGCISGGGQPKTTCLNMQEIKQKRMNGLYEEDEKMPKRLSYKNPEIIEIYKEFYESPNSDIAKKILHTTYKDKSYMLKNK